jgi:microcystin degradation protein MlrC
VNLGRTAVLRTGALRVIVTASRQAPNDPEQLRRFEQAQGQLSSAL